MADTESVDGMRPLGTREVGWRRAMAVPRSFDYLTVASYLFERPALVSRKCQRKSRAKFCHKGTASLSTASMVSSQPPSKDRAADFLGIGHSKTVFLGAFERLPGGILSSEHVHDYSVSVAGQRLA